MLNKRPGYLYVLYHPTYEQYGANVYKLGWTKDITQRMRNYRTGYLQEPEYKYTSTRIQDGFAAERLLFYLLRNERCDKRREFFQASLEHVQRLIQIIELLQPEELHCMYQQVCMNLVVSSTYKKFQTPEEAQAEVDTWSEIEYTNHLPINEFLQQFRYQPSSNLSKSSSTSATKSCSYVQELRKLQQQSSAYYQQQKHFYTVDYFEADEQEHLIDTHFIKHYELNRCSNNYLLFTQCLQELHIN